MRPVIRIAGIAAVLALPACGLVEGQASAKEACRDVRSIVSSAAGGTLPPPTQLLALEGRLRVGVDDPDVQAGGEALRGVLVRAAEATSAGRPTPEVARQLSGELTAAGEKLQPACAELGESIL